jgi:hypothetical protein
MRSYGKAVLALSRRIFLAGCATQPTPGALADLPGFWFGLLHGLISPFSLIGGLFSDIRIYAFPNNGGWYDFGFMVGAGFILGSSVTTAP